MHRSVFALMLLAACRVEPADPPTEVAASESRATAMPESLRCRSASECTPEPSCYWGTPACVAAATAVAPKCGEDADPPRPDIGCECTEGQCTPVSR